MTARGVDKFFYWNLITGCNVVLSLDLMRQICTILSFISTVMVTNSVMIWFIIVVAVLHIATIYLAFTGSICNNLHLMVLFFIGQTIFFVCQFGLTIKEVINCFQTSYHYGLIGIMNYQLFECGYYIGLMFIVFSRYKEIEGFQRN